MRISAEAPNVQLRMRQRLNDCIAEEGEYKLVQEIQHFCFSGICKALAYHGVKLPSIVFYLHGSIPTANREANRLSLLAKP